MTAGLPLHMAAFSEQQSVVELLLNHGANIEAKSVGGLTPLHMAAGSNRPSVVTLLLDHGAEIEANTNNGWTPLHVAAATDAEVVDRAATAGSWRQHPGGGRRQQNTPAFGGASSTQNPAVIQTLLDHGAGIAFRRGHQRAIRRSSRPSSTTARTSTQRRTAAKRRSTWRPLRTRIPPLSKLFSTTAPTWMRKPTKARRPSTWQSNRTTPPPSRCCGITAQVSEEQPPVTPCAAISSWFRVGEPVVG